MSELGMMTDSGRALVVPATIGDAQVALEGLDGLLTAGEWARAATVAAFVTLSEHGGDRSKVRSDLAPAEFAALGIAGLRSKNTVQRYVQAWQSTGLPRPTPGEPCDLPSLPWSDWSNRAAANTGEMEWYTPPQVIGPARRVLGQIDCDPASNPTANEVVQASTFYTADDDGLSQEWSGRVFLNPPYVNALMNRFIDKLIWHHEQGDVPEAITLTNNGTETGWGAKLLAASAAVCFVTGRVKFLRPDGDAGAPLQGQMVAYLGPHPDVFHEAFRSAGVVLRRG